MNDDIVDKCVGASYKDELRRQPKAIRETVDAMCVDLRAEEAPSFLMPSVAEPNEPINFDSFSRFWASAPAPHSNPSTLEVTSEARDILASAICAIPDQTIVRQAIEMMKYS